MAIMIGINCTNCDGTLIDNGTHCVHCGHRKTEEQLAFQEVHHRDKMERVRRLPEDATDDEIMYEVLEQAVFNRVP